MMPVRLSFRFFSIFLLLSSLLIWDTLCEAQSVESRVDNHSLEQKEEFIVPGNAKKSFLRSLQQAYGCNLPCNTNNGCAVSKGPCAHCVNNQCLSTTTPVCGTTCATNSHCYGGVNSCSSCVGNVCKALSQALQCGAYCTTDAMCFGAPGSCNFCVNNKCATRNNPSTGCGTSCQGDFQCSGGVCSRCVNGSCAQPQCGLYCYDNTGCSSGANGCTSCLSNGNGISVCSASSQCGSSCNNNNQCYGNNNGCTTCSSSGQCVRSNLDTACVSTFDALTSAASGTSDTITLCAGSLITLYAQLIVNRSGSFTLQCATSGSCTIHGNYSSNIVINAANAVITGITFLNCKSRDNGGAIMINAVSQQGSHIQSCTFNGNSAGVDGGAVYVNAYAEITNCFGASNWANQCKTIYQNSAGTCTALAVSS